MWEHHHLWSQWYTIKRKNTPDGSAIWAEERRHCLECKQKQQRVAVYQARQLQR